MRTSRHLIKHRADLMIYAIEADDDGIVLAALDVTRETHDGGLCVHMLASLPLAAQIDDVELINRTRDEFDPYVPDCGNVHHLMTDLILLEREHRAAAMACAMAESKFRSLKKDVDLKAAKVHELLGRIADRKPLPLFESIGG